MPDSALELVRRIYQLADFQAAVDEALLSPDIEWANPPEAVEPGIRQGLEAFMRASDRVDDSFESSDVTAADFSPIGDNVVIVSADVVATGRTSGLASRLRQYYVWTTREGRAIRFFWTNDEKAARDHASREADAG